MAAPEAPPACCHAASSGTDAFPFAPLVWHTQSLDDAANAQERDRGAVRPG